MATLEPPGSGGGPGPAFPQRNAFVLQFAADSGPGAGVLRGRIEHVLTGQHVLFGSADEMWDFVREVLTGGPDLPVAKPGA